jgi:hypothetical protein
LLPGERRSPRPSRAGWASMPAPPSIARSRSDSPVPARPTGTNSSRSSSPR